jgi:hypothetical protein
VCLKYGDSIERFFMDRTVPELPCYVLRFKLLLTYIEGLCFLARYALQREDKENKARDELEKIKLMAFTY